MSGYMPPSQVPLEPKWRHYPTYVYDKNYGYGMNYYQPMIDYVDRKQALTHTRSCTPELESSRMCQLQELPELPWSDGRALWEDKIVRPYSREDLVRHAIDAEDQARDHLSRFKVSKVATEERRRRSERRLRTEPSATPPLSDLFAF